MPERAADQSLAPAPVCIVGASGALGFGLAVRLGRAGVPVVIGSRAAVRAEEAVARAAAAVPSGSFSGGENTDAVAMAETVILCVPFRNQSETLANLRDTLRPGQLLIDTSVPLAATVGGRATRMLGVWQGSAAEQAHEMVPEGVRVVSALHTVSASALCDLEQELGEDVLVCGDDRPDKRRAAVVIEQIDGLRCIDCGKLELSRDHRVAHGATDLRQRAPQDTRGHQAHARPRRAVGVTGATKVVVLAGGTGGAKLARGMLDVVGAEELVVIGNTGDDIEIYGAHVSPDPDLISFWLADSSTSAAGVCAATPSRS